MCKKFADSAKFEPLIISFQPPLSLGPEGGDQTTPTRACVSRTHSQPNIHWLPSPLEACKPYPSVINHTASTWPKFMQFFTCHITQARAPAHLISSVGGATLLPHMITTPTPWLIAFPPAIESTCAACFINCHDLTFDLLPYPTPPGVKVHTRLGTSHYCIFCAPHGSQVNLMGPHPTGSNKICIHTHTILDMWHTHKYLKWFQNPLQSLLSWGKLPV